MQWQLLIRPISAQELSTKYNRDVVSKINALLGLMMNPLWKQSGFILQKKRAQFPAPDIKTN
jgi:hypothetical protein